MLGVLAASLPAYPEFVETSAHSPHHLKQARMQPKATGPGQDGQLALDTSFYRQVGNCWCQHVHITTSGCSGL